MITLRHAIQKIFRDNKGQIVISQSPNLPLIGWIILEIIAIILPQGHAKVSLQDIATAFLFTWAYLEITKGVNYFRKFSGAVVILAIILLYSMT